MNDQVDIAQLQSWIGRTETAVDIVTAELVARFSATFDLRAPKLDPGAAAPPGIQWCVATSIVPTAELARDGHPHLGGFLPPVPFPRRMWAGGRLTRHAAIKIGDQVERQSRIADVALKQGRTGPLVFVTVEHAYRVDSVSVFDERQDIVYRAHEARTARAAESPVQAPPPKWSKPYVCNEVLLFRYSALTFNSHRIHYDRRFCTELESYPGLVVHGPLLATLLLQFATDLKGGVPPVDFEFRSTAPLFDGDAFRLCARDADTGDGFHVWAEAVSGQPAMSATAIW